MGADYLFYTEVKRDDAWHAMNGLFYSEKDGKYILAETYWNGSRSYFGSTYTKLKELSQKVKVGDLSEEVREKEDWLNEEEYGPEIFSVDWKDLQAAIPKTERKGNCGYVHKRDIYEHEVNDEEIEGFLSGSAYDALSEAEKKEYEFYEWNDPWSWRSYMQEIVKRVNQQIVSYMTVNGMWDEPKDIRIICIMSC